MIEKSCLVRLHKFLADCGVASRRKSEELISQGIVSVNGKPVTRLGSLINPDTDEVRVKGQKITKESKKSYLMLNKPAGYITTAKDTHNRKTVLDLIRLSACLSADKEDSTRKGGDECERYFGEPPKATLAAGEMSAHTGKYKIVGRSTLPLLKKRLFPVGRLDRDTTGLLFLTDDGELAFRITHPRFEVIKTYEVAVDGKFSERDFSLIKKGIAIEGKPHFFKEIKIVSEKGNCTHLSVKMIEGKKRQIRIMFEALGYRVLELKRTAIGDVRLGSLREGESRELSKEEVVSLKKLTGLP